MPLVHEFAKEASNVPSHFSQPPPSPTDNEPTVIALFLFLAVLVVLMLLLLSSACQTWMMWKMAKAVVEREARFVRGRRKVREDEEVRKDDVEDGGMCGEDGDGERIKAKRGTWMGGWFGGKRKE